MFKGIRGLIEKVKSGFESIGKRIGGLFGRGKKKPKTPPVPPPMPPEPEPGPDYEPDEFHPIIDRVLQLLEEGLAYVSPKSSQAGAQAVRWSSERIKSMIDDSIEKFGADEVEERLLNWANGRDLPGLIERLQLAVYDSEFARWANGRSAYESMLNELAEVLEVDDLYSIF